MKSFSILALAATLAVVNAVDCDVSKITPLLTDPSIATCTADSGFSFTALAAPTAETLPKICASAACKKVLAAVTALGLGDCTLAGIQIESGLVTPITTACAKGTSTTSTTTTTTTTGSSAGSKASSATVTAPATTAPATTASKASSSDSSMAMSGSGKSSNTVKTPSASKTPAPSTSGASTITVAASAAVVAVAAAFM